MISRQQWTQRMDDLCGQFVDYPDSYSDMIRLAAQTMGRRKENPFRETGYIFYHGLRTARLCLSMAEALRIEEKTRDVIFAAALFHDVGKGFPEHPKVGQGLAKNILKDLFGSEKLDRIGRIVLLHNTRGSDDLPDEVKVVQDADILDHYGAQGVWLKFLYSAHRNESGHEAIEFWHSPGCRDLIDQSRAELNYELSKQIFEQRLTFQDQFAEVFESEILGKINTKQDITEIL